MSVTEPTWAPSSWRSLTAHHQPTWPDAALAAKAVERIRMMPPLVFAGEADVLTSRLAPGGRATYRFTMPVTTSALDVWTTPTLTSPGIVSGSCTPAP